MEQRLILDFLRKLQANNSVEWMRQHKEEYQEVKSQFEILVQKLVDVIGVFDDSVVGLSPRNLIYRQNRDIRFTKDKTPYNASFRAHISVGGRAAVPVGYYVEIKPNSCFLGGGLYTGAFADATKRVRDYMVAHVTEFEDIVKAPAFQKTFTLLGEKLKRVPAGYEKEHALADYLKHKSWVVIHEFPDAIFEEEDAFVAYAVQVFQWMKPFRDFLNKALQGFTMPTKK